MQKVVIKGRALNPLYRDIVIIKKGTFTHDEKGILQAFNEGYFDKYRELPPPFKIENLTDGLDGENPYYEGTLTMLTSDINASYRFKATFVLVGLYVEYDPYSDIIVQLPQKYQLIRHDDTKWVIDPHPLADPYIVKEIKKLFAEFPELQYDLYERVVKKLQHTP